ncbi:actin cytoskeleton-regulatory complex protein pan1 isoform X2 [Fopius arisanus]|uniref:Actin cytoskeleton-regulatory complex protein pan1 isoform X2 n=1 Tax=Fopius arisanus TaxID=64838 RepID=A0A9R1TB64_9HYME|nr:PREDICTED: actin cytoskeleton-regulatory complex protein pan1 isoform X2 [Fopius arisanus]
MSRHVVESSSELSAFMKGVMAGTERDAGFCSGGDEDDMSGLHSPSASEDSVEVQISPISLRNKRKLAEPRKLQEQSTAPLKKRRFDLIQESSTVVDEESRPPNTPSPSPFRPWSSPAKPTESKTQTALKPSEFSRKTSENYLTTDLRIQEERWRQEEARRREEEAQRQHEARIQEEVLARLQESEARRTTSPVSSQTSSSSVTSSQSRERQRFQPPPPPPPPPAPLRLQEEPLALVLRGEPPRVPAHPAVNGSFERSSTFPVCIAEPTFSDSSRDGSQRESDQRNHQSGQQRNYKNMTRERRIEANARERTRVHTISAAFDTLRKSIPAYSHNQKLSKLSVLRIACSYIMTLSKIANTPEGEETTSSALGTCVDMVSRTIQTEGKLRKKKDE